MEFICPKMSPDVMRQTLGDKAVLLRHKRHGTQLEATPDEGAIIDEMSGEKSLEELEELWVVRKGALAYQELMVLLYRLWDRGLLANGDEVRAALFPQHRERTLDRAMAWRRTRYLFSWSWLRPSVGRVFSFLASPGRLLTGLVFLAVAAALTLAGLGLYTAGRSAWPDNLFSYHGSWVVGIALAYSGLVGMLSLRGLVRLAILAGQEGQEVRAGVRFSVGLIYLDVDDLQVYHLPRSHQLRFVLAGLLVPGSVAGLMLMAQLAGGPEWLATWAAAGYLVVFLDLCPFFRTNGATLVEVMSSLHKQRFRVRSYIGRQLLRGLFKQPERNRESASFPVVATLWFLWFFAGLKLFSVLCLDHLLGLQVALMSTESMAFILVGGLFFAYVVVCLLTFLATMGVVSVGLLVQLLTPERADAPSLRRGTSALSDEEREALVKRVAELPVARKLSTETLQAIVERSDHVVYRAGSWVRRAGSRDHRVFWVLDGAVELNRSLPEGGREVVASLREGQYFGEETLQGDAPRYDARATQEARLLGVDAEVLRGLLSMGDADGADLERVLELARFLDGVPELAGLGPSGRLELATHVAERAADAGTDVVKEGDPSDSMYLIRSGRCAVTRSVGEGTSETLAELGAGQVIGEIGVLFHRPRTATVTAMEPTTLVEVSREALEETLHRSFHVGLALERLAVARTSMTA